MDYSKIKQLKDKQQLLNLISNSKRLGREDIKNNALKRLCELEGVNVNEPLERDFFQVLAAYEYMLTEKNGRTTKATRVRQKLKNKGLKQCLVDWTLGPNTQGFEQLIEQGLSELTAEYLVVKYSNEFSKDIVMAAEQKLGSAKLLQSSDQLE